jgi:hypothetical protein
MEFHCQILLLLLIDFGAQAWGQEEKEWRQNLHVSNSLKRHFSSKLHCDVLQMKINKIYKFSLKSKHNFNTNENSWICGRRRKLGHDLGVIRKGSKRKSICASRLQSTQAFMANFH